jgi:phage regulator Rha-like protein
MPSTKPTIAPELSNDEIANAIRVIRGSRVVFASDLAALYGVETKRLNEQVRRNIERFPRDFMFQLTAEELLVLRSQFATLEKGRGRHQKYLPYAFTEHGAIMAATVLNSPRAVEMSIYLVRAFVRMREMATMNKEIAAKFAELERRLDIHDEAIAGILDAIRALMAPPALHKKPIGFVHPEGRRR